MTFAPPPDLITDVPDLLALWRALVGPGDHHGRSAYFVAHDADGRPHRQLVAVDELPLRPGSEDLEGFSRLTTEMLRARTELTCVAVLLARPGTDRASAFEHDWAAMVRTAAGATMRWPICLATPHGVRCLEPTS